MMTKKEIEKEEIEEKLIIVDGKVLTLKSVIDKITDDNCDKESKRKLGEG